MNQAILKTVLLAVLLASVLSAPCQGAPNDLLQTGNTIFTNARTSIRQSCKTISVNYGVPASGFQAAASLSQFPYNAQTGLDYAVRAQQLSNTSNLQISLLLLGDNRWDYVTISYIASSRNDFWIGTFVGDLVSLSSCSNTSASNLQTSISTMVTGFPINTFNSGSTFLVQAMISGLRSSSAVVSLSLAAPTFNAALGVLTINIQNATKGIELIYISYVIITTPQNYFSLKYFDYPASSSTGDYTSLGTRSFLGSAPSFYGLEIKNVGNLNCTGSKCSTTCITTAECNRLTGNVGSSGCVFCLASQSFTYNQCVCPAGQSVQNGVCACSPGYINLQETCINQCGINEEWKVNACKCIAGYTRINSVCTACPTGSSPSADVTTCICQGRTLFDIGTFTCLSNPCAANAQTLITAGFVTCSCGSGYYQPSNTPTVCLQLPNCPPASTFNAGAQKCLCNQNGYNIVSNVCTAPCPPNSVITTSGSCNCTNPNQVYSGNQCICVSGTSRTNGICNNCPTTSAVSVNSGVVVCTCPFNQILIKPANAAPSCSCPSGFSKDTSGICSNCPPTASPSLNNLNALVCTCPNNQVVLTTTSGVASCGCINGFYLDNTNTCRQIPVCSSGAQWVSVAIGCKCTQSGYYLISGACSTCGVNQNFNGVSCVCNNGYTNSSNGICNNCPPTASPSLNANYLLVCTCPGNQVLTTQGAQTFCGCPNSLVIDPTGATPNCVTVSSVPTCPTGSNWDNTTLKCICTASGQYLIGGACAACPAHSGWNGNACICAYSYFLINGVCRTCDINTFYTGSDCVCNLGFYGNRDYCTACDTTCGRCSGPNPNQCMTCADISYSLVNTTCLHPTPCVNGMYSDSGYCFPCSNYCSSCSSLTVCTTCVTGFSIAVSAIDNTTNASVCNEICGDGKRFTLACDDGNTINGDGCSSTCEIQSGFSCSGGSPTSRSLCSALTSVAPAAVLTLKGKLNTFGMVLMGVTLSYIPAALTANNCAVCSNLILSQVYQSSLIQSVTVQYQPSSVYKFIIQYDFNGAPSIPPFTTSVQINPQYASYFTAQDMAQKPTILIDPSLLSLASTPAAGGNGALNLDTFGLTGASTTPTITTNGQDKTTLFGN